MKHHIFLTIIVLVILYVFIGFVTLIVTKCMEKVIVRAPGDDSFLLCMWPVAWLIGITHGTYIVIITVYSKVTGTSNICDLAYICAKYIKNCTKKNSKKDNGVI